MDITKPEMVRTFLEQQKPEYIIHLAALAGIPDCENNKTLAWEINVEATRFLLDIAKQL
jgi:dTDP-4-dehydrorhamnose reductase